MLFNNQTIFNKLIFLDPCSEELAYTIMEDCCDTGLNKTPIDLILGGNPYTLYDTIKLDCSTHLKVVQIENIGYRRWKHSCIIESYSMYSQVNRNMVKQNRTTRLVSRN